MDYLDNFIEWFEAEDLFILKYGLVLSNFVTIFFLLFYRSKKSTKIDPKQTQQTVLIVTAHPDDEAMFFLPTIKELVKQNYDIHLLCLTNGGFDGLGKIREIELEKCCRLLQIRHLKIIDDPEIQDGMTLHWPIQKVQQIIQQYVDEHKIEGLITFDDYGVSGHNNHRAVHEASKQVQCKKILFLESTNIVRKYMSVLDFFLSTLQSDRVAIQLNPTQAWRAMAVHKSQFVWYRKLFVIFSRYAYVNTLKLTKV